MRAGPDIAAFSRFIGALHEARAILCGPDLLASDVQAMKAPHRLWAHYDRAGNRQTNGMQALADRYGLRQLSVVTRPVDPHRPQPFLSAYRGGAVARPLHESELTFLACALDHMQTALDQGGHGADGAPRLLVDRHARPAAGSAVAPALWSGWRIHAKAQLGSRAALTRALLHTGPQPRLLA